MIYALDDLTPEVLTEILRTDGALERGQVAAVEDLEGVRNPGLVSNVSRLAVTYSPDARGRLPFRLFLKVSKADVHPEWRHVGAHEAEFYGHAAKIDGMPIPHCYYSEVDPETQQASLLLDDLAESHYQNPFPIPPSYADCGVLIDGLAVLHATFWEHPTLGVGLGARMTEERGEATIDRLMSTVPSFFDYLGDSLLPAQRRIYERILTSAYPQESRRRLIDLDRVTLVHGDVHGGNVLLPVDPSAGVKLIDWQLWDIGSPAFDLAFFMALHWPRPLRAAREMPLLQRYYEKLVLAGVSGYTWDDFFDDYRRGVVTMVLIPIGQFRRRNPAGVIWFGMQDATAAFEDLHCEEVLG